MSDYQTTHKIRNLTFISFAIIGVMAVRLIFVQGIDASHYRNLANRELTGVSTVIAPRGVITDINGIELAKSIAADTIIVDQTQIVDPAKAAEITAPILNLDPAALTTMLTGKLKYRIIAKDVTPQIWSQVQVALAAYNKSLGKSIQGYSKRINGFYAERSYIRVYPEAGATSSLIGFINQAGNPASGIESSFDSQLKGTDGQYRFEDGAGTIIPGSQQIITEPHPGTSIQLTINRDIQWVAQNAISTVVKQYKANSGTVIVMNPKTGAILAEASAPTFDPNNTKKVTQDEIRNPAVQDIYDPGSTGKVITVAAALESKSITPTSIFTIPNRLKVDGTVFKDAENHGVEHLTPTGILAVSSNIGALQIGNTMSHSLFYSYLKNFGIGTLTNSHLPGESAGLLPPVANWSASSAHTFAYGQGYSVTALQATQVFATVANDGVRVAPTILAGTYDSSGNYTANPPAAPVQVISANTAQTIRQMLGSVVSENGTAPAAAIPGYRVAGKTGTASRHDQSCNCYRGYTSSFIGFAPADAPQYVVSVVVQNPHGQYFGGVVAAPVFKNVMSFVLQTEHIPPTTGTTTPLPLSAADVAKLKSAGKVH
jgi:cell division protein FtsI (penicillin-binding protein 3)